MATATSITPASRTTPPSSRRSSHSMSTSPQASSALKSPISARSALSTSRANASLNSAVSRRSSVKAPPPSSNSIPEARDSLSASLKYETEKKEQLLVQVQNKEQAITTLTAENDHLMSALNAAETRLNDLYADQARMEEELAARIEVSEKLRAQVRELEKEKRDVQKRYNDQTSTFEAERQAFYDNEQHLKSRIQSLTQARRHSERTYIQESEPETEPEDDIDDDARNLPQILKQDLDDPESEPAEMTSLRLELSTLSTSYSSLQSTLMLLQSQLVDLKRVNNGLQEENESYMILLREKTLSGQFDLIKQVGGATSTTDGGYEEEEDIETGGDESGDVGSLRSTGRSTLDRVEEEDALEDSRDQELERSLERGDSDSSSSRHLRHSSRHGRKNSSISHSPNRAPRGESLADLPITGPGLDLAAELGRAENKDIFGGDPIDDRDRSVLNGKGKQGKKSASDSRKVSSSEAHVHTTSDMEALRTEVKSLKDANKALSLYASKIIDRIIAQEGFEHVLAIDYEKTPLTPTASSGHPKSPPPPVTSSISAPAKPSKPRPQSAIFARSSSNPTSTTTQDQLATTSPPASPNPSSGFSAATKAQRRSLSFDWKSFSLFGGTESKPESATLRPLTLKPGATSVTGARKLETYEDEEDRRERERLHATMKLMGIDKPIPSPMSSGSGSVSPAPLNQSNHTSPENPPVTATASRFSLFRSKSTAAHSDTSSAHSRLSMRSSNHSSFGLGISNNGPSELTQEALEQAEAENSLAALDAHERTLSEEIAKGGGSGFTELSSKDEWRSKRSKRSAGGSGSTVWSAGMSRAGDDSET
ncbi:hypothetical protein BJ138DRAFT_1149451 [Hygrophoropsis aurantiaca]|uniref:Uncharacterized protein n=1 Tax=Hygrophoropsis aurantiaca TaxID=72124 RepID=A0ACB8AFE3_9AGAM|nr:hypothetical protein BJ138DRAFT_1149451 [Hygrophoropsis aurantiaca]